MWNIFVSYSLFHRLLPYFSEAVHFRCYVVFIQLIFTNLFNNNIIKQFQGLELNCKFCIRENGIYSEHHLYKSIFTLSINVIYCVCFMLHKCFQKLRLGIFEKDMIS